MLSVLFRAEVVQKCRRSLTDAVDRHLGGDGAAATARDPWVPLPRSAQAAAGWPSVARFGRIGADSRSDAMVSPTQPRGLPGSDVLQAGGPWRGGWLIWLPMGFATMLLVLFLVLVGRQQDQVARLGELIRRVQNLETSRALERTAVLEQQLRSTAARLQTLERAQLRFKDWERQLQTLRQEMDLRRSFESTPQGEALREAPLPPLPPRRGSAVPPDSRTEPPLPPLLIP